MRLKYLIICILLNCLELHCKRKRTRRTLIWFPNGSRLQTILGAGFPVDLDDISITVGVFIKGNYKMPINATTYTNPSDIVYSDETKTANRWDVYEMLSQMAENYGLGGKVCILHAICESASVPFARKIGLFEEILHVILTPTTTKEKLNSYMDSDYMSAYKLGKSLDGKCSKIFPGCKIDILGKVSNILEVIKEHL